ncbi:hypothetical protein ACJBU6_06960 [Exserohilum turcicum]
MSRRRRYGLGGAYYPSRYYAQPPAGRYSHHGTVYPRGVLAGGFSGYAYGTGYHTGARSLVPVSSAMRTYYNTVPTYGYTTHVYPPATTTTTTTYHVTNSQAPAYTTSPAARVVRETRPAYVHGHSPRVAPTREDIQLENRRIATARGAYDARKIRPADARDDDPFWCREVNGEWHLRSYYQIENECHPGRWMMDAEIGFLVFHRA